jgi:hypothetical protein
MEKIKTAANRARSFVGDHKVGVAVIVTSTVWCVAGFNPIVVVTRKSLHDAVERLNTTKDAAKA